jgi:hypothetical protein
MIDSQDRMNWVGSNGEYNTICGTYSACRSDDHPGKWMLAVRRGDGPEKIVGYFNTLEAAKTEVQETCQSRDLITRRRIGK